MPKNSAAQLKVEQTSAVDAAADTGGASTRAAPLLRSDPKSIVSTAESQAFPCATKEPTPEERARLSRDEQAYAQSEQERYARELDYRARALALTDDFDFVEIVRATSTPGVWVEGENPHVGSIPLLRGGSECSSASDRAACASAVAAQRRALFTPFLCDAGECPPFDFIYGLTTRADVVRTYRSEPELRALLGPIDSPIDAWLLASMTGEALPLLCDAADYAAHRVLPTGYDVMLRLYTSRCRPLVQEDFTYHVTRAGKVSLTGRRDVLREPESCVVSGRRPEGLLPAQARDASVAALFARMAHLEEAAVVAFSLLERELRAHGLPHELALRLHQAAHDEQRHSAIMRRWAERFGATPPAVVVPAGGARSLFEIARENAVEGCVRELYGALVVQFQAQRAAEPALRRALSHIAADEAAHAELAHDLAAWLRPRLGTGERAAVERALRAALSELADELCEPSAAEAELAGMPSLRESRQLLAELTTVLDVMPA